MPPNPRVEPSQVRAGVRNPHANKNAVAAKKAAVYIGEMDSPACSEIEASPSARIPAKAAGPRQAIKTLYHGRDGCLTSASAPTARSTRIAIAARKVPAAAMPRAKPGNCAVNA